MAAMHDCRFTETEMGWVYFAFLLVAESRCVGRTVSGGFMRSTVMPGQYLGPGSHLGPHIQQEARSDLLHSILRAEVANPAVDRG